jgi:hypothetical protein
MRSCGRQQRSVFDCRLSIDTGCLGHLETPGEFPPYTLTIKGESFFWGVFLRAGILMPYELSSVTN